MDNFNPQAIFIVITVFILFVNKIVEMMRAKQAEKAAKQERQERREQSPSRPPLHQPQQQQTRQRPPQRQQQQQKQPPAIPTSPFQDVLTELFEAAGVPQKQAQQQQPKPASSPPPIPDSRKKDKAPKLSREERNALEQLELRGERSIANRHRRRREASDRITQLLLSKEAARQAIIVAEILGPPRGIRDIEYR